LQKIIKKMKPKYSFCLLLSILLFVFACKKTPAKPNPQPPSGTDTTVIQPPTEPNPTDPSTANTIGFFLDDWTSKTFTVPAFKDTSIPSSTSVTVNIDAGTIITKVPKSVFAHNANIWMTQMITEPSLMS
jgi:hypothetical protein